MARRARSLAARSMDLAGEDECDDGAGGIEVDAVAAGECLHGAVAVRHQDPHGQQGLHPQYPLAGAGPGQAQNRSGAPEDARRRERHQQERDVAAGAGRDLFEIAGVDHQAEGHHVHGEEGGDAGAQQQVFTLGIGGVVLPGVFGGPVANAGDPFYDSFAGQVLRAVTDLEEIAGEEDFGGDDASRLGERVLDQPAAGSCTTCRGCGRRLRAFRRPAAGRQARVGRGIGDEAEAEALAVQIGLRGSPGRRR